MPRIPIYLAKETIEKIDTLLLHEPYKTLFRSRSHYIAVAATEKLLANGKNKNSDQNKEGPAPK
jgi:hypothetical protein